MPEASGPGPSAPEVQRPAVQPLLIDGLKAIGCCLIVLHHLAFYGPMADHADDLFPRTFDSLSAHARLAVQVFLVLGGYLAALGLNAALAVPGGTLHAAPPAFNWRRAAMRVAQRFARLALPLWAALLVAVVCNAVADHWMDHHSISGAPDLLQGVLHLMLLQDLTGQEALSAGIWYVAIDFQLYALLMLMAVLAARLGGPRWSPRGVLAALCMALLAASAWQFNRQPAVDVIAPYFWVSYGLGVLLGLGASWRWLAVAAVVLALALWIDFRVRLAVAGATALLLWLSAVRNEWGIAAPWARWLQRLGRVSYSVFLIHFPFSLLVNALWTVALPTDPWVQFAGVLTAFALSLAAGALFHDHVELPLGRWSERTLFRKSTG